MSDQPSPSTDYPVGSIRALLATDLVTPPTRAALMARINESPSEPSCFDSDEYAALTAVCALLMPSLPDGKSAEWLASQVDARLAQGQGDGWRYAEMPPDGDAYRLGLRALDAEAHHKHGQEFAALDAEAQSRLLAAVRDGEVSNDLWSNVSPTRFFEELLAELTQYFVSLPETQEAIGYVGMADARGWKNIGLNEREEWETLTPVPSPAIAHSGAASSAPTGSGETAKLDSGSPLPNEERMGAGEGPGVRVPEHDLVDVVVIGTGAGGAPVLARLAAAGLSVVALEAGPAYTPERDFATDEHAQMKLYWQDERLSGGHDPLMFGGNNSGTGVGGSTLHYTAYTPRPSARQMRLYSEEGVGVDWPLAYADLVPYYEEIERFLGVSGPSPYLWEPERSPYSLPPLPLNAAAQLMRRGSASLGIRTSPAPNAALSKNYHQDGVGWRPACTNRGFCQAGCSVRAKGSMDVTYLPYAALHGAQIRPGCFVTRIETGGDGRVTSVVYTRNGQEERQRCRALFVCAGAIETPRLLLLNNLANGSGQVGRNFMAHTGVQVWGHFDEETRPWKGIPGGLISEDTQNLAEKDFAGGYLLQSIGVMPVTYATQYARAQRVFGEPLMEHLRGYNHTAGINILGDCLPYESNTVMLSNELDARGLPKPYVQFTAGENEKRMTAHADKLMRDIWAAAGAQDVWSFPRYAHTIGTCRMGSDSGASVVNPDGRAHEIPNLYIADNSVFPSALSANPALTIMAVALRTADKFLEAAKRG